MEKRVVLMPHHKAEPDAEQIADDGAVTFEWEASMADLLTYGIHITSGGKRIDPLDFYIEPQEPNMQTPLERAARALAMRNDGHEARWDTWLNDARAVLEAIREPNPAHIEKCSEYTFASASQKECAQFWQAMLDTALKDE